MAYEKQGFYSGEKLKASQLDAMEDGIINAEKLAMEGAAGAANMEKGAGDTSTQQVQRASKVVVVDDKKYFAISEEMAAHIPENGLPMHVIPNPNKTSTDNAFLLEYGALGRYSAVLAGDASAENLHSVAINNSTLARGEESFSQGYETVAEGSSSSAMGSRTWARGTASHTEGLNTQTVNDGAHAEGGETKAIGKYSHAEGEKTTAHGDNSHSEGALTQAGSYGAHAEGNETIADTNASHTEGSGTKVVSYTIVDTTSSGSSGSGSGSDVPSQDDYTDLEDYRRRAAACGHAEGNNNTTMGYGAHSEGVGTTAYGHSSHTEGWGTQAGDFVEEAYEDGQTLHIANRAKGLAAHAEGYNTKAIANYSHAAGIHTVADKDGQTVVGQYNNTTSRNGSIFVVGGGQADGLRKNALEVIQNGEIIIFLNGSYYSLNDILNLLANKFGGFADSYFDPARR
jgi:hypothetical protein